MKIPKKYEAMLDEQPYKDSDGWWATLKEGYYSPTTDSHTVHEDTAAEFMISLKQCVPEVEN